MKHSQSSISWGTMLWLVLGAIMVAAFFAYLLVYPFFHQPHR
ncbi:hypothetical protein ACPOL_3550 [Acidisarcina polymorpha]|uniref:Uncharacterized protein n=1 Tax=Acidisarcina polymorpha TaxID=2211140 RepID=A0A2Z5G2E2_9BACT|nr:hypothetical protein [Acidisarcina polymorpha]AXC12835.1 hypothetical protein ACPOL_3550 [Acidisarcina polymorpha]